MNSVDDSLWLKQWRTFFYVLAAVFIIWLGANMSERKAYGEQYSVEFAGIDTIEYAIVSCDKQVALELTSNGFHALHRSIRHHEPLTIDVANYANYDTAGDISVVVNVEEVLDQLRGQLDMRGVASVHSVTRTLTLKGTPRQRKAYIPDIDKVDFRFEGMCGLNGTPRVTPDTVWLYGSKESLDKIKKVSAKPQSIKHIFRSGNYKVSLEPAWEQFGDVRPSTTTVEVFVPVESFIEKELTVPVTVVADSKMSRVLLYPDQVSVHVLVPNKDYGSVVASDFEVTADIVKDSNMLNPVVTRFPSNVRIKSIDPPRVQYIVISD